MTEFYESILFSISASAVILSMFPQIVRCIKRRSAADVSMLTGLLIFAHCVSKAIIEFSKPGTESLLGLSCVNACMITIAYTIMIRYRYPKGWKKIMGIPKKYWDWLGS